MTLDQQAEFLTKAQRACKKARETGAREDLMAARALLDGPEFGQLDRAAQLDLQAAFRAAFDRAVEGGGRSHEEG